ncbi:MAG: GAF domain-containing protein, partial [Chloroflexota bacterium]
MIADRIQSLWQYTRRPRFSDPEMDRQAALLWAALTPVFVITLLLFPALPLIGAPLVTEIPVFLMLLVDTGVWLLVHSGRLRPASILLVTAGWIVTTLPAFLQGGLVSPFALFAVLWVVVTGLLLDRRFLIGMLLLNLATVTALLITTTYDLIPPLIPLATPLRFWNIMVIVLVVAGILIELATSSLRSALSAAQQARGDLQAANTELLEARQEVEERVAQRTAELERRARELQASSEVVRAIASIRQIDSLLSEITVLISQHFGFYQVLVFLFPDQNAQQLQLRAANTEAARRLVTAGFSVNLEQASITATAARTTRPYLAPDVARDPLYLGLKEFPETRSELALPLISSSGDERRRLLGVLDLQSSSLAAFGQSDLGALQTLASQIAIAIENAQLYSQNQQALQSLQNAYTSLSQAGWSSLLRAQPNLGYRAAPGANQLPAGEWDPEMSAALNSGQVVQTDPHSLSVPIRIRDQVTGVVRLRKPPDSGAWTGDEIGLVATLADRLSTAL